MTKTDPRQASGQALQIFWTIFLGIIAFFWVVEGIRAAIGIRKMPHLAKATPLADADCPWVSVIFAARDEEEKLPQALATMLALDYPNYEIVAVNDRSRDSTPQILEELAKHSDKLKVIHVDKLPAGWVGKPHALQHGYQHSTSEWLVFTDADVRFAPDLLRRALRVTQNNGWDHFTLLGRIELEGFWEKVLMSHFHTMFTIKFQPWRVSDPKSEKFLGAGMFQLVRRAAYEASGTHRRLALEVIDDMKLGKIIKQAGFRSGVGVGAEFITVRWQDGIGNIIRGCTKNMFAGVNYSLPVSAAQTAALFAVSVLPLLAALLADGWARGFALVAAATAAVIQGVAGRDMKVSPLVGLTHPLGALIFAWMLVRSTVVTLWRGGVVWRDTFYPLEELRKGLV